MIKKNDCLFDVTEKDIQILYSDPSSFWKGVTKIGKGAFEKLNNFEVIEIPESIEDIDEYAFNSCENLRIVNLPKSIQMLKRGVFQNCVNLDEMEIPKSVMYIESEAFYGCKNLKKITLQSNVILESAVFGDCENLTDIIGTENIRSFGDYAFMNCKKLKHCIPQKSCSHLGEGVFAGCESLRGEIQNGVRVVGKNAFLGCKNLKIAILPESVMEIDDYVFKGCKNLKVVLIPDSVEDFGLEVFEGCDNLKFIFANNGFKKKLSPDFKKKVIDLKFTPEKFLDLPSELFSDKKLIGTLVDTVKLGLFEQVHEKHRLFEEYKAYCIKLLGAVSQKIKNPNLTANEIVNFVKPAEKSKLLRDIKS